MTDIEDIVASVRKNPSAQGHICINNSDLFDFSVANGIYGFPGVEKTNLDNLKTTAWRSISSLFNIGPNDLVLFYRTASKDSVGGSQEFHGVFKPLWSNGKPSFLLHCEDDKYLPMRKDKGETQYLPFRFLFEVFTKTPISIPNDLRNQSYKKTNNLAIIKAMSETDPDKPQLWGFRHPAVMNIGAARKSSIVALSNSELKFFLQLLSDVGVQRPNSTLVRSQKYDRSNPPKDCCFLDDDYLSGNLERYLDKNKATVDYEAEIYAYLAAAFKNPKSVFHKKAIDEFASINTDLPFESLTQNVIVEMLPTPHIQEEIDILLCDSQERNFMILEIKNNTLIPPDLEQAEKYIQLISQRFPKAKTVTANVIGAPNPLLKNTRYVKAVGYEIEGIGSRAFLRFEQNK